MITETERLTMRKLTQDDFTALCSILQDEEVMYAYEHAFDDREVQEWLDRQIMRYETDGFGLWAVILQETGELIGQCGLTMQDCMEQRVAEVGYLFQKKQWHMGYATEAAMACRDYAFDTLGIDEVYSIIRHSNEASIGVAKRNGMTRKGEVVKFYYGMEMPHTIFSVKKRR